MNYKQAGVDISAGDQVVEGIKQRMGASRGSIGHFGGAFPFDVSRYREPLLVSSVDGVGTKTAVAIALSRYDVIGRDMVHHAIGDIAVCGAEPLFFLDYIAMGKLEPDAAVQVIGGAIDACKRWGVVLVGGETAEMPGVYIAGELDFVGCIVGVVEKGDYIDGKGIVEGDILVGFPSAGLHTNGFSLARRAFAEAGIGFDQVMTESGATVGDALLAEHVCYLDVIRKLKSDYAVKGLAHITGGGLEGNTRRIIPKNLQAEFDWGSWPVPAIFELIRSAGSVPEEDMRQAFNLGIGLVAALSQDMAASAMQADWGGMTPRIVGRIVTR
jgi:phosphoribosylformylglycinamidine cyclo-ligase